MTQTQSAYFRGNPFRQVTKGQQLNGEKRWWKKRKRKKKEMRKELTYKLFSVGWVVVLLSNAWKTVGMMMTWYRCDVINIMWHKILRDAA